MYQNLIAHIKNYFEIDDITIERLCKSIKSVKLKKKDFLLNEGQYCRSYYFVEQGCLRMYYINRKLAEQITQFALEGWWLADFHSLLNDEPSQYFIQTIEKSEILVIDRLVMESFLDESPELNKYFRLMLQKSISAFQQRQRLQFDMTKEEFFLHFTDSYPEFFQRVPQYMIASYLGLTPEYLSELRKKNNKLVIKPD